jgi:hypothetical protein
MASGTVMPLFRRGPGRERGQLHCTQHRYQSSQSASWFVGGWERGSSPQVVKEAGVSADEAKIAFGCHACRDQAEAMTSSGMIR